MFLTFICPCIADIFAEYNQQGATFLNLFISVRRSACFRRFFRPPSGAQNRTYSVRYLFDQYCWGQLSASPVATAVLLKTKMNFRHLKILAEYNQQDATFHSLFVSVRRSTCFRRFSRPSSGAQNCTYNVRPILLLAARLARLAVGSSIGLTLYVQFWAPDDGRKSRLKHVERLTEINKLRKVASCRLYSVEMFLDLFVRIMVLMVGRIENLFNQVH